MSNQVYLLLYLFTITVSAEVLLWAWATGQLRGARQARFLPLRDNAQPTPPPRAWTKLYWASVAALIAAWIAGISIVLYLAYK